MKKLLLFAAIAAIAAGCAKEPVTPETSREEAPAAEELVTYTFSATADEMKATISDAGAFSWSAGDEIAVWNSSASEFVTFTSSAGDGNFTGSALAGAVFTTAYYPASVAVAGNPSSINLPSAYTQAEATGGKIFPMIATVDGSVLAFSHLGALLKVSINDVPANATTLTLTSADATVCGTFSTTGQDANNKNVISAASGSSTVTVSLSNSALSNLAFYLPLPTGTYNYTIALGDGTTTMLSQATTSAKTRARAKLYNPTALTVQYPTTNYEIVGWFAYNGADSNWSTADGSRIPFEPSNVYGWLVAKNMGARDNHVSFKLKTGGTWTGTTVNTNTWRPLGTGLEVSSAGTGNDITIKTTESLIDIYYNPDDNMLFAVKAGSVLNSGLVPLSNDYAESFSLIGYHADDSSWGTDYPVEGAPGSTEWFVVRNIGTAGSNPHMDFKLRKDNSWGERVGTVKYAGVEGNTWKKTANTLFDLKKDTSDSDMENITVYVDSGRYDFYFKSDFSSAFLLPAGSQFALPTVHETIDHYTLTGEFNFNSTDYSWGVDIDLSLAAGTTNWLVVENVNTHTSNRESGFLTFKFRLDRDWTTTIGDTTTDPWHNLGDCVSASSSNNSNINYWAPSSSCPVDIYLKTDMSQFGVVSHGTSPSFL